MWLILLLNLFWICLIYLYYLSLLLVSVLLVVSMFYVGNDYLKIFTLLHKLNRLDCTLVLASLMLCICMGFQMMFPENIRQGNSLTNILAHYVGYVFGFIVPAIVSIYIVERRNIH